jgi:hypothetical protein
MVPWNNQLFDAEYRAWNKEAAYLCVVGDKGKHQNIQVFIEKCENLNPVFDPHTKTLLVEGKSFLKYEKKENLTQYI